MEKPKIYFEVICQFEGLEYDHYLTDKVTDIKEAYWNFKNANIKFGKPKKTQEEISYWYSGYCWKSIEAIEKCFRSTLGDFSRKYPKPFLQLKDEYVGKFIIVPVEIQLERHIDKITARDLLWQYGNLIRDFTEEREDDAEQEDITEVIDFIFEPELIKNIYAFVNNKKTLRFYITLTQEGVKEYEELKSKIKIKNIKEIGNVLKFATTNEPVSIKVHESLWTKCYMN